MDNLRESLLLVALLVVGSIAALFGIIDIATSNSEPLRGITITIIGGIIMAIAIFALWNKIKG